MWCTSRIDPCKPIIFNLYIEIMLGVLNKFKYVLFVDVTDILSSCKTTTNLVNTVEQVVVYK